MLQFKAGKTTKAGLHSADENMWWQCTQACIQLAAAVKNAQGFDQQLPESHHGTEYCDVSSLAPSAKICCAIDLLGASLQQAAGSACQKIWRLWLAARHSGEQDLPEACSDTMQEHMSHRQDPDTAAVKVLQHSSERRHAMAADILWPRFSILNQASALHVLPALHARGNAWVKEAQPDCGQICLSYIAHEYMQCSYIHSFNQPPNRLHQCSKPFFR